MRSPAALIAKLWLLSATIMIVIAWPRFGPMDLRDPDDAMRLLQVRDWLAGQAWFDVTQYRVHPPGGGPMHWSRIVDLPIAGVILATKPFFGQALAERIALGLVPLLLLAALFFALWIAARRIGGDRLGLLSVALIGLSVPILIQFQPLRIDHHGWQILMAAVALVGAFDPSPRRGGVVAGVALALWLNISSEALPYAGLFGLAFGIWFLLDVNEARRLLFFTAAAALLSALLLVGLRGPAWSEPWCDSMSPLYVLPLVSAALLLALAYVLLGGKTWQRRLVVLVIAGVGSGSLFLVIGRPCLAGPFATLDPLVYRYWYLQIMEGRPIWEQSGLMAATILLPSIIGLAGSLWATFDDKDPKARLRWLTLTGLAVGGLAVAVVVMRAMSVAHLFALPGNAWLLLRLYGSVAASRHSFVRVVGTVSLFALTPIGLSSLAAIPAPDPDISGVPDRPDRPCNDVDGLGPLAALPPGIVMAPLDISPNILLYTSHSVVGTSHHRNRDGMKAVIATFLLPEPKAHAVLSQSRARYLAFCPDQNEMKGFVRGNTAGLSAQLAMNRVPAWLKPLPSNTGLKIYRVEGR